MNPLIIKEIKKYFQKTIWYKKKITYNNNETLLVEESIINNIKIVVYKDKITTQHLSNIKQTYREHFTLYEVIREVEEDRFPLFNFSMF